MVETSVRVITQTPEYVAVQAGPIVANLFIQEFTMPVLQRVISAHKALYAQYPTGVYHVDMFLAQEVKLGKEVQEAAAVFHREVSLQIRGVAFVFEQTGIKSTIIRSLVTANHIMARPKYVLRSFGVLREGVPWLTDMVRSHGTSACAPAVLCDTIQSFAPKGAHQAKAG